MGLPSGYKWDPHFQLGPESSTLMARVWPKYITDESDLPEPSLKVAIHPDELKRRFPAWGIRRGSTGKLVAYANAAHVRTELTCPCLPDEGWAFAIQSALSSVETNSLCLLVANVDPEARGLGLASLLVERAKEATRQFGYSAMIAPVRPTRKQDSPLTPMFEYLAQRSSGGEIRDPWVRVHVQAGGEILNVCSKSVRVRATLEKWREWTGLSLSTAGSQVLPGALAPLRIDLVNNIGTYHEPNVWVRYNFGASKA